MKTKEEIIVPSDDRAASIKTITGWVSRNGRFYGDDEHQARYDGSTRGTCSQCGSVSQKSRTKCDECIQKDKIERFNNLPIVEWDGKTALYCEVNDKYFWHSEEIDEFLEENELTPDDLQLFICEPEYASEISSDIWEDILPGEDHEVPKELENLIKEFNEKLKQLEPLSYFPSKVRTDYIP